MFKKLRKTENCLYVISNSTLKKKNNRIFQHEQPGMDENVYLFVFCQLFPLKFVFTYSFFE